MMKNSKELIKAFESNVFNSLSDIKIMINNGHTLNEIVSYLAEYGYKPTPSRNYVRKNWDFIKTINDEIIKDYDLINTKTMGKLLLKKVKHTEGNLLYYKDTFIFRIADNPIYGYVFWKDVEKTALLLEEYVYLRNQRKTLAKNASKINSLFNQLNKIFI